MGGEGIETSAVLPSIGGGAGDAKGTSLGREEFEGGFVVEEASLALAGVPS